ncbi:hypothetical protein HID58_040960 [Brassica napus]|uniref:Uncharacterized protein n=1 Tax=Brassica napus TaxID=3708 RepID=A0ABQ8B9I0_BRANA|nr:hypothetical protein HID58_040960 [Brassica napus]
MTEIREGERQEARAKRRVRRSIYKEKPKGRSGQESQAVSSPVSVDSRNADESILCVCGGGAEKCLTLIRNAAEKLANLRGRRLRCTRRSMGRNWIGPISLKSVALSLTEILMGKQFRISWLGGIVDERKVVKQHLLAWRTKAIPDPTLMPQGRTYARKEAVTLLKKADFGNFDKKQSPYLTLENLLHHQLLCLLLTITDYAHELLVLHASSLVFEASPLMSSIMVGFISFFLSCLAFFFSTLTGDIGSSSTTKSYVDSKGRFVDQSGFTWIGAPVSDDESTPPGETEIDAFVDMETLKFTSPEKVFLLQPEISRILDAMGDDTVKYKLEVILAKDDKI